MISGTAVVWRGDSLTVEEVEVPPGDTVVEIALATVCGSDLHTVSGRRPAPCPSVLGHEAVGRIVSLPTGGRLDVTGRPLHPGDRVVWGIADSCGRCDRCRAGHTAKCRALRKTGHEPYDGDWPLSGGYASHIVVPAGVPLVRVPDRLSDAAAAISACAVATVAATLEAAGPVTGRRVLISGIGMLGLVAVAMAAQHGATEVLVSEPDEGRRDRAMTFGATRPVADDDLVDIALELSGAPAAVRATLDHLDVGATMVLAGSVFPGDHVDLDPQWLVRHLITVRGVHNYEPRHLVQAIDFLASSTADWGDVVAPPAPLADLPRLLTAHPSSRWLRTSVRP